MPAQLKHEERARQGKNIDETACQANAKEGPSKRREARHKKNL
jgi:hypothetical protein